MQSSFPCDSAIQWTDSDDPIPNLFVVVPTLDNGPILKWRSILRLVVPCQGPSILTSGGGDSFHITGHDGYTIEYPRTLEHRHRNGAKVLFSALKVFLKLLGMSGRAANIPSGPTKYAASTLSSPSATADNKARMNAIGIDTDNMFSTQVVVDSNQQREMEWLLRRAVSSGQEVGCRQDITGSLKGIVVEGGRTLWVCSQCLKNLRSRIAVKETDYMTLTHYKVLSAREPEMEVTLCNDLSVAFFTNNLFRTTSTKLTIHIVHGCFEAIEQTSRKAIAELFNQLGQALSRQRELIHLEIRGQSLNGEAYSGTVYAGLDAAFQCRSLKTLRISGIPCLLQDKGITIKCRNS
ncbi:hypothetical protein B0O80DRAFT_517827 [Mortierella sp. GBAus27b]|nr:hypothetical protein B0O80DRAFT_517827 [Mortierella sp. GBAus27b]